MELDWVSVFLGVVTVLIFMQIFTLLRAMTAPFVKRFEKIFGGTLKKVKFREDSYCLTIKEGERTYELYEIKEATKDGEKTVYNNYIFLKLDIRSSLCLKISNSSMKKKVTNILGQMLGTSKASFDLGLQKVHVDGMLTGLEISSNNTEQAREFLNNARVGVILKNLKALYGTEFVMPLFIEPGSLVLDYRLTSEHLNEIINHPKALKKYINNLDVLATALESLEK